MKIEHGFCQCGCGQKTGLAVQNNTKTGYVKGQPYRYANGHNIHHRKPKYIVDEVTGCWNWQRSGVVGYGRIRVDSKTMMAHRYYYEQARGPIPEGLELDHLCRNRACVNPDHLEAVTGTINIQRCPATKLKPGQVIEIRYLHAAGIPAKLIAPDFGISHSSVLHILKGASWNNV